MELDPRLMAVAQPGRKMLNFHFSCVHCYEYYTASVSTATTAVGNESCLFFVRYRGGGRVYRRRVMWKGQGQRANRNI